MNGYVKILLPKSIPFDLKNNKMLNDIFSKMLIPATLKLFLEFLNYVNFRINSLPFVTTCAGCTPTWPQQTQHRIQKKNSYEEETSWVREGLESTRTQVVPSIMFGQNKTIPSGAWCGLASTRHPWVIPGRNGCDLAISVSPEFVLYSSSPVTTPP